MTQNCNSFPQRTHEKNLPPQILPSAQTPTAKWTQIWHWNWCWDKKQGSNLDTAANVGEGLDPLHSWHGFGADHSQCAPRVVHLHGQLLRHRHSLSSDIANLSTNKNRRNSLKISLLPLCLCLRFEGGTEGVCACMACGAWPDGKGLREWMRFWGFYLRRKDFWPTVTAACKCGWCYLVGCPNVWSWLQIPICMHRPKKYSPASFSMN